MSRLIDADLLIEAINKSTCNWAEHLWKRVVCDVIGNQPTAFDTEKVVARLEHEAKLQGYFRQDACKRLNVAQGNIHRCAEQCYQNAIDIVKRGAE